VLYVSDFRSTEQQMVEANRNAEIIRMLTAGVSAQRVAEHFKLTRQRIHQIKQAHLQSIPAEAVHEHRVAMLERLEEQRSRLSPIATSQHPRVAVNGRVVREGLPEIVEDDEGNVSAVINDGRGSIVLDPTINIQAEQALLKVEDRVAKLLGLDSAVKVENSGSVEIKYTVHGVDVDNL
jgi:hypothetical protein